MLSRNQEEYNIIHIVGKEKETDIQRRLKFGLLGRSRTNIPSTDTNAIYDELKYIARAVMRDPDQSVLNILYAIHDKLKQVFLSQPNHHLHFLLEQTTTNRGGFNNPDQFKRFLEQDASKIQSSRLITGIESILTCIIYCRIRYDTFYNHDPLFSFKKLITNLVPDIVPHISETYIDREDDKLDYYHDGQKNIAVIYPPDISEASGEDVPAFPTAKLGVKAYKTDNGNGNLTFPGAALKNNISICGHVSGTAPSTLSAVDGLLSYDGSDVTDILPTLGDYQKLAGAMFAAPYLRANFHTPAETHVGLIFYLDCMKFNIDVNNIEIIQPRDAFIGGLELLYSAANTENKYGKEKRISLQSAIKIVSEDLIEKIGDYKTGYKNIPSL